MRRTIRLMAYLLVSLVLLGCGMSSHASGGEPGEEVVAKMPAPTAGDVKGEPLLRVTFLPTTDALPLYIAEEEGLFDEAGIDVALVPAESVAERERLLREGRVDGMLGDPVAVILANAAHEQSLRVVRQNRVALENAPRYRILSAPNSAIRNAEGLHGTEIAVAHSSEGEYLTERLLRAHGAEADEIMTTDVAGAASRLQQLLDGEIAAATLPEPIASHAANEGAVALLSDAAQPTLSQSLLAFRSEVILERRSAVERFLSAYDHAQEKVMHDPDQYRPLLQQVVGETHTLPDSYSLPIFRIGIVPDPQTFFDAARWVEQKGLVEQIPAEMHLIDQSFGATR